MVCIYFSKFIVPPLSQLEMLILSSELASGSQGEKGYGFRAAKECQFGV